MDNSNFVGNRNRFKLYTTTNIVSSDRNCQGTKNFSHQDF